MIKIGKDKAFSIVLSIFIPIIIVLIFYYLYREFFYDNLFINKVMLKKDMEFKYFTYDEFDSVAGRIEGKSLKTYYKKGKYYIVDSGKENMSKETITMLDRARNIVEIEWNDKNPTRKIVFVVNSGYRSNEHNKEVGGVENSAHRNKGNKSHAVDISWYRYQNDQKNMIKDALYRVGFRRFGIANGFLHVDNDLTLPNPAHWTY